MKRIIALLLAILLLISSVPFVLAEDEDEEISLSDLFYDEEEDLYFELDGDGFEDNEAEEKSIYEADGSVLITITATGDFTIGSDSRKRTSIFNDEFVKRGKDLNFTMRNIRDLLVEDDLTIVNFEGTLTESKYIPSNKKNNEFLFSAPPSYVSMLSDNSIEAVSLENNHVMDHGEDAYIETQQTLEQAGIVWSNSETRGVITVKGVQICMLSYLCIDRSQKLYNYFCCRSKVSFGIGTFCSNDTCEPALNIVIKLQYVNGRPVAKLSDVAGKEMCQDPEYLEYLRRSVEFRMNREKDLRK